MTNPKKQNENKAARDGPSSQESEVNSLREQETTSANCQIIDYKMKWNYKERLR